MKDRYYKYYEFFVVISVTLAVSAQSIYDKEITKLRFLEEYQSLAFIIGIFASLGVFYILFTFFIHLYKMYFWRVLDKRYYIDGDWEGTIIKTEGTPAKLYGVVSIEQSYDKIVFSAKHYEDELQKKLWSHWTSTNVFIINGNIEVYWEVQRLNGEIVTGKISFKIDGRKPPRLLDGIFRDNYPSNSCGRMLYSRKD